MKILEYKPRPNQHQTHAEDLVLLGEDGLEELNDKIEKFLNKPEALNQTTKIDGAPAVVCWSKFTDYPDNSICLKSFLTSNRNVLSSFSDIEAKYGDRPDMAAKLKYCLEIAHSIPAGEAWQGDCLYSKDDLREVEINGKLYLTFHPNKIVYAFGEDNPTYEEIKESDFGICFHTIYKGNLEHKSQSFNVNASRLNNVPSNVYIMSPALNVDRNTFDTSAIEKKYAELLRAEDRLLNNPDYEELCNNSFFMGYWNTFENANLSDKSATTLNVNTFFSELKDYIRAKQNKEFDKKMSTLKTDAGKQKAKTKYEADLANTEEILETNKQVIVDLVRCLNLAAEIKMLMWAGYKQSKQSYNTFYLHREQGYIPADMEGVALSDQDGNIVKVVDRSTFSHANRSSDYLSGFEHESLEEDVADKDIIRIRVYIEPTIEEAMPSGRIEDVYDEQTLEEWYDFAATIEGIIERHGDTVKIQLSKNPDSLSEYIDFYTINSRGDKQPGMIDLRLSDHPQTDNARRVRRKHASRLDSDYQLKSVTVNDRTFNSYDEAIQYIRNMFNMKYEESFEEDYSSFGDIDD